MRFIKHSPENIQLILIECLAFNCSYLNSLFMTEIDYISIFIVILLIFFTVFSCLLSMIENEIKVMLFLSSPDILLLFFSLLISFFFTRKWYPKKMYSLCLLFSSPHHTGQCVVYVCILNSHYIFITLLFLWNDVVTFQVSSFIFSETTNNSLSWYFIIQHDINWKQKK